MTERLLRETESEQNADNEAGGRVLREILRTPAFREIIKIRMKRMSPDATRQRVKALMEEDASFSLGLAASSPQAINCLVEALLELGDQLGRFTPEMTAGYLDSIVSGVDQERLKKLPEVYGPVLQQTLAGHPEIGSLIAGNFAKGINAAAQAVNEVSKKEPGIFKELFAGVQWGQVLGAFGKITFALAASMFASARQYISGWFGNSKTKNG